MPNEFVATASAPGLVSVSEIASMFRDGVIAGVHWTILKIHQDPRGQLVELFRTDQQEVPISAMGYMSKPRVGLLRGPHEHVNQTDVFVFCDGDFDVYLWDRRKESPTCGVRTHISLRGLFYEYHRVVVPPGVVHAYTAAEEGVTVLNFPDRLYKGPNYSEDVDEYRHEEDPESPFKPW